MKKATAMIIIITGMILSFMVGVFVGKSPYDGSVSVEVDHKSESYKMIDINHATLDELCLIPGISVVTAQRIVEYRENNGPFHRIEDLCKVEGISEKRLDSIRDYILVD